MREVGQKRKHKRKRGCGTNFCAFLIFLILIIMASVIFVKFYNTSDWSKRIKQRQYPIENEYFVNTYSEEYGLDRFLVFAIIRTESKFEKDAMSRAGAKGLMQLTDETGRDIAKKLKIAKYSEQMLFDPETNILIGCYYFSTLLKKYDDIDTALAAYNGGPANVDKWLRDKSYSNGDNKLTEIPFDETKSYVKRVNDAYEMYKELYGTKE